MPPTAKPHGYSLAKAAETAAYFNTGPRTDDTLPKKFPFQILYANFGEDSNEFQVKPGTPFYVPIAYSENSLPVLGDFPDVKNRAAVANYFFSPEQLGAEFLEIEVDGEVTSIGPEYVVGAETPNLPTGGDLYTTAAVFLTPLSKGKHTVVIRARFSGEAFEPFPEFFPGGILEFENTYTVFVR